MLRTLGTHMATLEPHAHRYLAKEFGLGGANNLENAQVCLIIEPRPSSSFQIDEVVDALEDLFSEFVSNEKTWTALQCKPPGKGDQGSGSGGEGEEYESCCGCRCAEHACQVCTWILVACFLVYVFFKDSLRLKLNRVIEMLPGWRNV